MSEDLRYPVGKFEPVGEVTPELRREFIQTITDLPQNLARTVEGLNDEQLDTPYRPGGWTVRQTVHHVADSHLNSYCRFKLAVTEEKPTIRPYYEDRWAELADSKLPIDVSLSLIEGIHTRWVALLESFTDEDFAKELIHPESGVWTMDKFLGLYDWHSKHHTAHIAKLRERNGW
ncbi:MAG: bacillithiol transferase BstA [Pyrinomonadaceae bacterium]